MAKTTEQKAEEQKAATEQKAEELSLAEVQAQIAAMLAEAKAEAAKIVEDAKAASAPKTAGMTAEELAKHKAYMNEYVEIKLFKDTGKYKDPVFVSVNGETCAIERGEKVKVKRKFALALDNSDKQDYETAQMIEQTSGKMVHYNPGN